MGEPAASAPRARRRGGVDGAPGQTRQGGGVVDLVLILTVAVAVAVVVFVVFGSQLAAILDYLGAQVQQPA